MANLRIQPDQVNIGAVSERERKVQTVTLVNAIRGWLRADIRPVQTGSGLFLIRWSCWGLWWGVELACCLQVGSCPR